MGEIQQNYRKRKTIYLGLIAALFAILIAFRFIAPEGEHKVTSLEAMMIVSLIGIVVAIYAVFRCPKCKTALVPAYSASWGKLNHCPKCGVNLSGK
ncbi:MAG: zf-TFIIB domain-containing protein [Deltaproteobacteria bacterium]|nr:zf-TFIIB domain-containing protein [Deltaproteobacteria bacterium]